MPTMYEATLRHARYYVQVAEQAQQLYLSGEEAVRSGLSTFDREQAQIDSAYRVLLQGGPNKEYDENLINWIYATVYFTELRYTPQQQQQRFNAVLASARRMGQKHAEMTALGWLGNACLSLAQPNRAITYYNQALVLARELGERAEEGQALGSLDRKSVV